MFIRSLSGIVLVAVLVLSIYLSVQSFGLLWWIISFAAFCEIFSMDSRSGRTKGYFCASTLFLTMTLIGVLLKEITFFYGSMILAPMIYLLIEMLSYKGGQSYSDLGARAVGFVLISYVSLGFGSVFTLTLQDWPGYLLIFLFSVNWLQDTFAYIGGRLLGRTAFSSNLSPKKTWEGALIGFVSAVGLWIYVGFNFSQLVVPELLNSFALITVIVAIAGQLGDLLESFFKRSLGVKDSGRVIPGHGGVLDRFDSIILSGFVLLFSLIFIRLNSL